MNIVQRAHVRLLVTAAWTCLHLTPAAWAAPAPAFPGAEGFGAGATGGMGGSVYHVTNLSDTGPGSVRDAVSQGHRIVVFDVGGYIVLKSPLSVHSDLTLLGQTAPGDGIGIIGQEVSFSNSHNVIVRYIRFRQGLSGGHHQAAVAIHDGSNMIFDHVSIEWGRWDTVDMTGSANITIQYSIIGEGINPQRFGCLCQSDNVTFSHDLWINNQSRNPKAKGHVQFINNVVYNWGVTAFVGGHSAAEHDDDLINNYFIAGPSSSSKFVGEWAPTDHVYQSGNYVALDKDGKLDGRSVVAADFGPATVVSNPMTPVAVKLDSAKEAYEKVLKTAGCSLRRDSVDLRLLDDLSSLGTRGRIIEDPADVGGPEMLNGGAQH